MSALRLSLALLLALCALFDAQSAWAQSAWYDGSQPHVQIDVAADGVYRIDAASLRDALPGGTSLSDISPETIRLIEKGTEVPIHLTGTGDGQLDPDDTIAFVGQRNRGTDELWAYDGDASAQSSTYYSLYSDTTTYWLTWGGDNGLRYQKQSSGSASPIRSVRDTLHMEEDNRYYFGRPGENGNARYTESEGYFWRRFSHNSTGSISETYTLPVGRRADTDAEQLNLSVRLDAASNSCHYVEVEARLRSGYESVATVEWRGFSWNGKPRPTITASIDQDRIPDGGLDLRLTSYNSNSQFTLDNCNPSGTPNYVLLDWIEARYTRTLAARGDRQRFVTETATEHTYELSGYAGGTVQVYNPRDARRFAAPVSSGQTTFTTVPNTAPTAYWAVGPNGFRSPAAVRADASSHWSATSNEADYLILTTAALRPSAQRLANYRASADGGNYDVEIATVQNVFDEFDYGRPTPLAIRRFVQASQEWNTAPDFLTIFGDAQYPIDDGSVDTLYPAWSVPSFGYSPSDGWFAMQTDGPDDWSEVLAVGRIPVRSVAQGDLFIEKLKTYESAAPARWPKRMLLLAGGTDRFEQDRLQFYSNEWGEIAADTFATTTTYEGPAYTGMDTLRYYKKVTDALDASFQDSLSVDLQRGAGWLSYFGHSAAQTWEIVTDPPSEFDNAGKLPVVVSLGCRTGSFAGAPSSEKSAPSLGEELVVGDVNPDGTPQDGTLNGGIAHFGESALGNRRPSARINDALIQHVFLDTTRVLGEAIRAAKADVEANYGNSEFYVKHLLQYGLLGDPATQLALPDKPDLHVDSDLVSITPIAPTPFEELTVSVEVQSRGLIPSDSVDVRLTWERPDGSTVRRARRVERFPRQRSLQFSFSPTERALGTNTFRVAVDPTDAYAEANETDNTTQRTQTIFSTGVSLISPSDFGTVSTEQPTLTFSVSRQQDEPVSVIAQLDTVPDFSSPFRRETQQEVGALVGTWTPSNLDADATYYWRARAADTGNDAWTTSQFTVRPPPLSASWRQVGRLFSENANQQLTRPNQSWTFSSFDRSVSIMSERGNGSRPNGFVLDGTANYEYLGFGFGVLVVNDLTGAVRASESFPTYNLRDNVERQSSPEVGDEQMAIDSLRSFLDVNVREGDYVFVRTRHIARESDPTIPGEVKSLLRNLGSTATTATPHSQAIDTLSYRHVWVMAARKGYPDETVERVSPPSEAGDVFEIIYESRKSFSRPSGTTLTPRIGPVSDWGSLSWSGALETSDNLQIDVLAADSTVLIDGLSSASGQRSLASIDAAQHPYLRLRATLTDSTTRTAPQLTEWSVAYTGVPELAVDPAGLLALSDTLAQGARGTAALPVANLGSVPSDSVRVQYTVTDASNATVSLPPDTLAPLPPGARDTSAVRVQTADLPGRNVLTATVAAEPPPERLTNNNAAVRSFFVQADRTAPSVRVLANGRAIPTTPSDGVGFQDANLPFVSTSPSFEIVLEDNNANLPLDDTSHVEVSIKGGLPQRGPTLGDTFRRVSFADEALQLVPPDSSAENVLRVLFDPDLQQSDSTYTLKVEAEDAKGNAMEPYQGSFRVQQDQVIKDVYPYPNPMSSHTTFAFRVQGGSEGMLHDFALRIYTLSGRLVREFTDEDLETPLGVGWNTLRWNGRDEDGDRVATGVYLYRVRVEGDDQTFRGNIEKVTVIR
jgi:hypothetical protein